MRSKLNVTLVLALFGVFSVATACGDDDTNPGGNSEAGESAGGSAGATGSGGTNGGKGGKGGSPAAMGGEPSSNGGNPPSNGGEAGSGPNPSGNGGEAGSGPDPSGNGGEAGSGPDPSNSGGAGGEGSGGEGGGGPVVCTEITLGQFEGTVGNGFAVYLATFTPNVVGASDDMFELTVMGPPDYDGGETGTFDLTANGDDNYRTCSRCFRVIADFNGVRTVFFQSEGTLVIDDASTQLAGVIDATVTNLKLVEVTTASDFTSTPVPGGACLTVASATIEVECGGFLCQDGECLAEASSQCDGTADCDDASDEAPTNALCIVPDGWECAESDVGDGFCDCGCGAKDTDCTSTTDESECEYCSACIGSLLSCPDDAVDSEDTTTCL
jgi:hypothetical protein